MKKTPKFSIITRTCGRPIMLKRALESITNQTYKNYELIIINDGGDMVELQNTIFDYVNYIPKLKIVHTNTNRHMERASNLGLKEATGEYICVHDDDDSYQPTFLEEVLEELENSGSPYPAVMTHFNKIFEEINVESSKIRELVRIDAVPWMHCLQLGFILAGNIFPPISLVYKREILEHIGMYDEHLKVLGDWDMLLRIRYFTDIKVLKKPLANYHIRVNPSGVYGNSINTDGWSNLHIEYEAYVRHKYQYTKVLLPNFEKRDIGSDIVNAKAHKRYWHWDYIKEIESILKVAPNYKENMEKIVEKISIKYTDKEPSIYMYGAGKLYENLENDGTLEILTDKFPVLGVLDKKFTDTNHSHRSKQFIHLLSPEILKDINLDIDVLVVNLEYPPDVLGLLKTYLKKDVDIYCIASSY